MVFDQFLNSVPDGLYWLFLFASAFIENIFPPWPGDTATVFGAYLAGSGRISLLSLGLSVYLGSLTGAFFMYFLGEKVLHFLARLAGYKPVRELLSPEHLQKTHDWFNKFGVWAVVLSRFSAGIRFFVAIVAGMVEMNLGLFWLAFTVATLFWNSLLIYGGYSVGENWQKILDYLEIYNYIAIGLVVAVVAAVLVWWLARRKA